MYEFKEEKTILSVSAIQTVGDIQVWRIVVAMREGTFRSYLFNLFMNIHKNPKNQAM